MRTINEGPVLRPRRSGADRLLSAKGVELRSRKLRRKCARFLRKALIGSDGISRKIHSRYRQDTAHLLAFRGLGHAIVDQMLS